MKISKSYRISQVSQDLLNEMKAITGENETKLIELGICLLWLRIKKNEE